MLKVEMNEPHKKREEITEYPCLGQSLHTGLVVLFYAEKRGVVVVPDSHWGVGRHSITWAVGSFVPFKGELKLTNG